MAKFSKFKNIFGLGDDYDDDEIIDDDYVNEEREVKNEGIEAGNETYPEEEQGPVIIGGGRSNNKVLNIHNNATAKVVITKPTTYEESMEICDALKHRRIVVINTSNLENKVARRLLDFISGSSYALEGEFQEIEKGVYILSPSNVEVTNELKSEITSKAIFGWPK